VRALESVSKLLEDRMPFMHTHRFHALWRVVLGLIHGKQLWLTALGRSRPSEALPKHGIKAVDRLLGNAHLHAERVKVAAALVSLLVREGTRPIVIVDTMEIRNRVVALSAAIAAEGRSAPAYSMIISALRPNRAQCREFLTALAVVFPPRCRPVVVTDGGFESEWFDEVTSRGWDYVGRVRGHTKFLIGDDWVGRERVHALATSKPRSLGLISYPLTRPSRRRIVLSAKPRSRHRQVATRTGPARDNNWRHYRKNAHEPLVLATSLRSPPRHIVALYKTRMQCEQSFRDVKNHRWGWSLRHCGTCRTERVELLLLIASIAAVAQQLVGIAARRCQLHRRHQANTVSNRSVLSNFLLGGFVINSDDGDTLPIRAFDWAVAWLRRRVAGHIPAALA
jgi:hypothetical protein